MLLKPTGKSRGNRRSDDCANQLRIGRDSCCKCPDCSRMRLRHMSWSDKDIRKALVLLGRFLRAHYWDGRDYVEKIVKPVVKIVKSGKAA